LRHPIDFKGFLQEKGVIMRSTRCFLYILSLWGLVFFTFPSSAVAQNVTAALKAADHGDWAQLNQLRRSTSNVAAVKTLNWFAYSRGSSLVNFEEISNFIVKNQDWPALSILRREAEERLSKNTSDVVFLKYAKDNVPSAANAMDRYLRVLIARGKSNDAKRIVLKWWPEARLTREEQKNIYARYGHFLNRKAHASRLKALMYKSQYSNAEAIADVLGGRYSALVSARKALKKKSKNANALLSKVPSTLQSDEGLLFDRLQWRRKNNLDSGAIEILNKSPRANKMYSAKGWWRERHIIARRLIERKQYKAAYRLTSSHKQTEGFPMIQAEWVSGWLALRFVKEPWKAFEHFEKIYNNSNSPLSKSRGAYWAGRASEALKHGEVATQWYNVAAAYKETYYGQLAAEKMGKRVQLPSRIKPNVSTAARTQFKNNALVKAASWLHAAGLQRDADLFLLRLAKNAKDQTDYLQTIQLADKLGRSNIGIKIAQDLQREKGLAFYQYLYPTLVNELRKIKDVEWAFINAIIRQESRFDQKAKSPAGARGLMQLMPATARETARKAGVAHQTAWLTMRPSHNIYLGSRYLGQMRDRFGGEYAYAAAAYNAGPGRVDRWLREFGDPRRGEIDFLDWVELIPIYETRNYVQRVLEGVYVYRDQLRHQQKTVNGRIHTKR
jgi:soluble lytic murein transglycosylase